MNYGSILDKFLCDALIKEGVIDDDNAEYIKKITFEFAGYADNAAASVEIEEYKKTI